MKSYHKELWLQIPVRMDFVSITSDVERALQESGIQEGLCLVNAMHITKGRKDMCSNRNLVPYRSIMKSTLRI
jgi:Uncharacterised protein family UPF0047